MSTQSLDIYKGLATYFLPDGVLDYFDIVDFAESPVSECENKIYLKELHLYLDECDNRTSDMQSTTGNDSTHGKNRMSQRFRVFNMLLCPFIVCQSFSNNISNNKRGCFLSICYEIIII